MTFQAEISGLEFWPVFQAEISGLFFIGQNFRPKFFRPEFQAEIPGQNFRPKFEARKFHAKKYHEKSGFARFINQIQS